QRAPALPHPRPAGADRARQHRLDQRLRRRPGDRGAAEERRGAVRRRPGDPGRAGGDRPGGGPVRRPQPERLAARHRRDQQRRRQRRRDHAAPRARGGGPHRRLHRRPQLLHVGPQAPRRSGRMTTIGIGLDTVERAQSTPEELQPYEELGLRAEEYERIREILGRRPTESELAMYSIMWSEHCSYKSSKVHLRQFSEKAPPSDALLAGIGENAGVVKVADDLAVTFKIESHNHPSYVEPYQGAATGVGGIVRDILAMGARPVAVLDPLRFGAAHDPDTARVLPGVVSGIGGYGNRLGLPTIGGEIVFDPSYQGNPLVNALCVGVMPVRRLQRKAASGPGNIVVLLGAKTGRD